MNTVDENAPPPKYLPVAREVAVGIAATLFFFFSALLIPIAGFFVGVFTPLPTLLFFYRWGNPLGYCIPGGAALAGAILLYSFDMVYSISYLAQMLILGLILGGGMRSQWSIEKTIGSGSLVVFLIGALVFWIVSGGDAGIIKLMEQDLREAFTAMVQQYGTASPEKQLLETTLDKFIPLIARLLPGIVFSSTLVASWLNTLVAFRYCKFHGLPLPAWGEWSTWKSPEFLVWGVIASGFIVLLPQPAINIIGQNALLVFATVYLFQGLAILSFYFELWKIPRILRGILYAFLFLQLFATLGATLLGLFDVWFDFRRISQKPADGV